MIGGSSSIVCGLGTINGSVLGGAIVVEGVIGGTAQVTYGGMILSASAKNFGNDLNKLKEVRNKGTGSRSGNIDVDNLPSGWSKTTNNGFTHMRYENGKIRVRIDPPDGKTPYSHKHLYDKSGNSLDINGNIANPKSPDAHISLK